MSLPKTLNETYERILRNLSTHRKDRSIRLLQFLAFSSKPLTLEEAVDIIAVSPQGFQTERRMPEHDDVLRFCPGLISIVTAIRRSRIGFSYYKSTEVQLAHCSVKEYLLTIREAFEPVHASIDVLRTCLTYYSSVQKSAFRQYLAGGIDVTGEFPLLDFIFTEWMNLVLVAEEPEDIVEKAADILQDSRNIALWTTWANPFASRLQPDGTFFPDPLEKHKSGLHYACRKKLWKTSRALMLRNVGVDTRNGYMTALQAASCSGLLDIVQHLLRMSSRPDDQEGYDRALQIASKEGHYEIVKQLLCHGANINSLQTKFCDNPALLGATRRGHREIVKLLLENGADINLGSANDDALSVASMNGFREIVELLLKHGVGVKSHGQALINASEGGHYEVVKLLLDYRIDVNAADAIFPVKALLGASEIGHINISAQVVNLGANVNARGDNYVHGGSAWKTPLLVAPDNGDVRLPRLLVQHGADANAQVGDKSTDISGLTTALQKSSIAGCVDSIQLRKRSRRERAEF